MFLPLPHPLSDLYLSPPNGGGLKINWKAIIENNISKNGNKFFSTISTPGRPPIPGVEPDECILSGSLVKVLKCLPKG
jgi:hypothetical protein